MDRESVPGERTATHELWELLRRPFNVVEAVDSVLGPDTRSTAEVMGIRRRVQARGHGGVERPRLTFRAAEHDVVIEMASHLVDAELLRVVLGHWPASLGSLRTMPAGGPWHIG